MKISKPSPEQVAPQQTEKSEQEAQDQLLPHTPKEQQQIKKEWQQQKQEKLKSKKQLDHQQQKKWQKQKNTEQS